jgi:ABC-type phosphate transport system substrate-binding protein
MKINDKIEAFALAALFGACLLSGGMASAADFVVIVNKANTSSLDKVTVAKIYSGEMVAWPDGVKVAAVDLPEDNPVRLSFCTEVLGKTVANVKALWAQLVFSGRALPPKQVASDDEVKKRVAANRGGIGYIKASSADDTIRVGK